MNKKESSISIKRKKQICEAAKKCFLKKGFKDTTMEDVILMSKMSKGGVYYYYSSTSSILCDLMKSGNYYRFKLTEDFIKSNPNLNLEKSIIEAIIQKLFDKNDYKSIFSIFLIEASKNPKLKKLEIKIIEESKLEFLDFLKKHDLYRFKFLIDDEFIAFINSIIVSTEILDNRDILSKDKGLIKEAISNYFRKNIKNYKGS